LFFRNRGRGGGVHHPGREKTARPASSLPKRNACWLSSGSIFLNINLLLPLDNRPILREALPLPTSQGASRKRTTTIRAAEERTMKRFPPGRGRFRAISRYSTGRVADCIMPFQSDGMHPLSGDGIPTASNGMSPCPAKVGSDTAPSEEPGKHIIYSWL
jgi:hypothetical protein